MSQVRHTDRDRALVQNAADPEQVKQATTRTKLRRDRELDDVRAVMSTPEGRRVMQRLRLLMERENSHFSTNGLRLGAVAALNDLGLYLETEMKEACFDFYLQMQREAREDDING